MENTIGHTILIRILNYSNKKDYKKKKFNNAKDSNGGITIGDALKASEINHALEKK